MQTWTKPEVITITNTDYSEYIRAAADSNSSGRGDGGDWPIICVSGDYR